MVDRPYARIEPVSTRQRRRETDLQRRRSMRIPKQIAALGSRPHRIGFYLIALIVLAVIPLVVIAGVLVARQSALQREAFERSLLQTSLALSLAVDRQLNSYRVMLETLAQADELRRGDIDAFRAFSARVAQKHGR